MFVATDLEPGEASPEGTEQIQMRWVPFDEAMAMIAPRRDPRRDDDPGPAAARAGAGERRG